MSDLSADGVYFHPQSLDVESVTYSSPRAVYPQGSSLWHSRHPSVSKTSAEHKEKVWDDIIDQLNKLSITSSGP